MWPVAITVDSAEKSTESKTHAIYTKKYKFGGRQFLESKINIYSGKMAD